MYTKPPIFGGFLMERPPRNPGAVTKITSRLDIMMSSHDANIRNKSFPATVMSSFAEFPYHEPHKQ